MKRFEKGTKFHEFKLEGNTLISKKGEKGKDAKEISLDEFVETMTGPEGSDVEFVLRAAGDTGDDALETVKVTRRFLGT